MSYRDGNKEAWEEAFEMRAPGWGQDIVRRVGGEEYPFFSEEMAAVLRGYDVSGKSVGQFCSNNGRELLSWMRSSGAGAGLGFDIAENQVAFANAAARELGMDCRFEAADILELGGSHDGELDAAIVTIGALCWFEDLAAFFSVVARCMKEGGVLAIHEQHPVANMLGAPGEENYVEAYPANLANSYFQKEWTSDDGMAYIAGGPYPSKTFTDFTHSFSAILSALCDSGFRILALSEYDKDISGMFGHLAGRGIPLSYIIEAKKAGMAQGSDDEA